MWTTPNIITCLRVALIPLFVYVYFLDWQWAQLASAFVFWLAAVTDWLDGYLARKLNQTSAFGAFLDPVADKLIVAAALILITHSYGSLWITLPAVVLLSREIYVSALREWMAQRGKRDRVQVGLLGKAKTLTQMLALIGLLANIHAFMLVTLGHILLYVAAVLSVWSMYHYTQSAWHDMRDE
jgi:CDP-diacylglycerol--glycerol-3-phosphate 3-phosphatidyltransferase